ncbi:hypothetical protein CC99x_002260 [Candidatus Berkiella cookevillensis]|uniref:Uncharacterized protein n=1 Tax=Candidatus Berkiella cookevillensis TaxID=437022 RepID=A0A0Q9Y8Z9_9GAMM|nr:hypothetical protein [Candidatus Berkiella cookevillensis]MCS5707723.1 hypothetical protein [Candidatus Berkiella cookevillensis]
MSTVRGSDQYDYNLQLHQEQKALFALTNQQWGAYPDHDYHALQTKTLERLDQDIYYIQQLNQLLKSYPASDDVGEGLTWSLKTNKMELVLSGARELIMDDEAFIALLEGECPPMLNNTFQFPVILGDTDSIYGSSEASFLSAALLTINLTLLGENTHIEDLPIHLSLSDSMDTVWMDYSALSHITPIPAFVALESVGQDFKTEFSYYFSDALMQDGLSLIHSGYAFGGQRGEVRFDESKNWGPEDCSSWVSKVTNCDVDFSTIDQLFTYRMQFPSDEKVLIYSDWLGSDRQAAMQTVYSPVYIENPLVDIHPGQIFAYREFADANHLDDVGIGGHTGVVLGVKENGNVVILCYGRDMPEYEGFGVREYNWQSDETHEVMFFDVNQEKIAFHDVIHADSDIMHDFDVLATASLVSESALSATAAHFYIPAWDESLNTLHMSEAFA